ncbi:MAG: L,D-transpeptidase [Flavobacteriaceae bacterium]
MISRFFKFAAAGVLLSIAAGCVSSGSYVASLAPVRGERFSIVQHSGMLSEEWRRKRVDYSTKYAPGTIVVDTKSRHLYFVEAEGKAIRYGIGVGRAGFAWSGNAKIGAKQKWPTWTPPAAMIGRQPYLRKYASGMPGGPQNPLGARAMYLYSGGRDTMYRLHGTNEPYSIGTAVSSGCIRMLNEDVADLYERAKVGTRVVVR